MNKPIVIIGSGGHTKVLIDVIRLMGKEIVGITDPFTNIATYEGYSIIGDDNQILNFDPKEILLVNGLGSTKDTQKRKQIYCKFQKLGYTFDTLFHPSAIIAQNVYLEEGVQIMAGVVIQPGSKIGKNSIVNTRASIDHDSVIGSHVHIAPGVTLSGNVIVHDDVHIGTGATIIQGLQIGEKSLIAAGAVVVKNVPSLTKVQGIPAYEVK